MRIIRLEMFTKYSGGYSSVLEVEIEGVRYCAQQGSYHYELTKDQGYADFIQSQLFGDIGRVVAGKLKALTEDA